MPNTAKPLYDHVDGGLGLDIAALRALDRRRALGLFGLASGAALLGSCGPDDADAATGSGTATPTPSASVTATPTPTPSATSAACTGYATETNGPYPADGTNTSRGTTSNVLPLAVFQRQDIRSSLIGSSTVATGVQLDLTLTFVDVNAGCAPLAGYAIYVWHCNATGSYSLYDLPAESYLRGIQVTDANGQVTFRTIVPGCYAGRYPHIHFEAFSSIGNATSGAYARLISQFAMPAAACTEVYALDTYGSSLTRFQSTSIASDNVFGDNTAAQKTAMTLTVTGDVANGLTGSATVGITS